MSYDATELVELFGNRPAYLQVGNRACLLAHEDERPSERPRQAVQQFELRAGGAGNLLDDLRQVGLPRVVARKVHRPQPGSKERGGSPLSAFGGPRRHSSFEFRLRVAAVPRSLAAMEALEASAAIRELLDLELMTLRVVLILRSEPASSRTP